ncbi:DUF3919 family protein [Clostridium sp. B9]|uniref:DUF3919 family protein n=1 Tax=Clostridium sp. B9 TaxID=3423224 RepID=UPI003D2F2DE7
MKKYIFYFLLLFFAFIACLIFLFNNNSNTLYGKVTVVENKETALKSLNVSIPEQIIINTDFYRDTHITNKLEMDNILDLISSIKNSSSKENEILESKNSSAKIYGRIVYNNKVDTFSLNNTLIFNNEDYTGDSYLTNNLHKKLMNYFNTYKHLIDILNNANSNVLCIKDSEESHLTEEEKEILVFKLSKFKIMNDKDKLNKTKLSDSKLYTLKIKINKNIESQTDNLIYIDVYPKYIIIQFLADDNGKKIYMEGNLDEI